MAGKKRVSFWAKPKGVKKVRITFFARKPTARPRRRRR
jgi:hypothetical protein